MFMDKSDNLVFTLEWHRKGESKVERIYRHDMEDIRIEKRRILEAGHVVIRADC